MMANNSSGILHGFRIEDNDLIQFTEIYAEHDVNLFFLTKYNGGGIRRITTLNDSKKQHVFVSAVIVSHRAYRTGYSLEGNGSEVVNFMSHYITSV